MIEASTLIGPVLSALCAFAGSWVAFSSRLAKVEAKLDMIEKKQDKHNNVIERTFIVERDVANVCRTLDEVKEEMHQHHPVKD